MSVVSPSSRSVVGGGVYLGERRVLTCSHVVNDALGRNAFAQEAPEGMPVRLAFPCRAGAEDETFSARPVVWIPARRPGPGSRPAGNGDLTWSGDLAVLELADDPPPDVRPMRWAALAEGQDVRAWYGSGLPFTYADGSVRLHAGSLAYIDSELRGAAMGPGYSGGPLWCDEEQAAVGIVLGVLEPPAGGFDSGHVVRRTVALPWQALEAELSHARLPRNAPASSHRVLDITVDPADLHAITAVLSEVLGDPQVRAAHAQRLAEELGLPVTPATVPSVDEVVDVLVTRHRAVAVLAEGLAKTEPDATLKLLSLGRAALIPGMLSVREHRWLFDLLPGEAPSRLAAAARAALPDSILFQTADLPSPLDESEDQSTEQLVEALEEYWGDSAPVPDGTPRVPALLRAVEYLAATCEAKVTRKMQDWCEAVAKRLGVAQAALQERRDDATAWAGRRRAHHAAAQPRLTVQLTRCAPGTYRCASWYHPGSVNDEVDRQVLADDDPRTPAELTRLLHTILVRETAAAERSAVPVIEVLLDADDLDEPVERWANEAEDAEEYEIPLVLGAEYAVVVRCPELRRQAERLHSWRARWAQLDRGGLLRLDQQHATSLQVYGLLKADLNVARVIIDCHSQHRAALRAVCLVLGVPVVMWDRDAPGGPRSDQLAALMLNGPVRGLPHRVRRQRARALGEADAGSPAPALIWDDATRLPPLPYWSDPTCEESTT
ncbi:VMAP-C domain-containing protein [Streptomyces coffeae]|uniref:Trypsin-like peptidase domain-containing protein n=1 Tax=Streptomyces coffeae TaxID=621382 RepID=A0ABS1NNS9_9ACTN|nr:trypsin-like peptidase domain-containing protein [Streptomyces coffeae]MBL1101749.1 trypsin-like peptidase domain-containing protein [Streptomyces coffeae]